MISPKRIFEILTKRYHLVVRNEENLEEKSTIGFTYAWVLGCSLFIVIVIFVVSLLLARSLLAQWFDPRVSNRETQMELYNLALKIDSLSEELEYKDDYIDHIKHIFGGDSIVYETSKEIEKIVPNKVSLQSKSMDLTPLDYQFRKDFEQTEVLGKPLANTRYSELSETFFYSPITGFISEHYDPKKRHYGVDLVTKTNEPVKSIASGTVIISSWTQDAGYIIVIQHSENLISVYKHNASLLKKVGSFVSAGDIIAINGNSGEMTTGPHLHFELWFKGNSLNPEEFVTF